MSTPEQDAIIGRTLREYGESKKKLAALYAEAERIGNDLTGVGHALRTSHSLAGVPGFSRFDPAEFPTVDHLVSLASEIERARTDKTRLATILRDAGHQIPD
jgi:hypothetical protein